ncbi:MAG: phospholipase D-like domain-containing protein [Candidatus Thorarchaeota archaeon]
MTKNHHKLMGLLIVFLMVMTIAPMAIAPVEVQSPNVTVFEPSETYEWETFNRNMNVTTFVSPDGSKDELWHFLNAAEQSIYVEIYGINHPHILDLIHELHDTKPSLDMKFLIGWNSLGYPNPNKYVANNLTELGYEVKWTNNSDFTFAHQKFLVIDNKTTIVHAGNWAKTSFPDFKYKANREWSIAMTDTEVASYYLSVFDGDWFNGTVYDSVTHGTGDPLTQPSTTSTYESPFATAGEFSGSMNVTPIFSPDTSLQGILYCISAAQATLDIQIPYFTSIGDGGEVDQVVDAILAAYDRGVTVRVITDEEKDFLEIAEILTDHGIPIVWHDTRWFTANHNKGIIVDGRIVLISSINYSDGSISKNREAGVIIEHPGVAQWYSQVYDFDWGLGNCDEMDEVNVYWTPNIPSHSTTINVTVYGHELFGDIDEVELDVKIGDGVWNNYTITSNVYNSSELELSNFFYEIAPQADGTNITVVGRISVGATWHTGIPMVIRVRDSIGSVTTPLTTSPTTTPTITDDILTQYGGLIIIGLIAAICGGGGAVAYSKGMLPTGKKKRRSRRREK